LLKLFLGKQIRVLWKKWILRDQQQLLKEENETNTLGEKEDTPVE